MLQVTSGIYANSLLVANYGKTTTIDPPCYSGRTSAALILETTRNLQVICDVISTVLQP
jgi:hypothetical protein